jgi:SH3-like domain-containing protein
MVIEKEGTALFSAPKRDEHPIAHIKKNVIMSLLSVQDEWCKVEVKHNGDVYTGWIKAKHLFGAINE